MVRRVPLVSVPLISGIAPVKKRVPLLKSVPLESIPIENNDVTPMETEGSLTAGQQRFKDKVDELEKRYTKKRRSKKKRKSKRRSKKKRLKDWPSVRKTAKRKSKRKKAQAKENYKKIFNLKNMAKDPTGVVLSKRTTLLSLLRKFPMSTKPLSTIL